MKKISESSLKIIPPQAKRKAGSAVVSGSMEANEWKIAVKRRWVCYPASAERLKSEE